MVNGMPSEDDVPANDRVSSIDIEIFDEEGALSREFLLQRGFCCDNGCKNCPYGFHQKCMAEGMVKGES
jgi:hypothetical protein